MNLPTFDFRGRTVLVTGSTQNLGLSIAEAFAGAGARVVIHGPSLSEAQSAADALRATKEGMAVEAIAFDLGSQAEITAAFADLDQRGLMPDVLVNNAAHLGMGSSGFLEQSPDFFRSVMEVNLFGSFLCSQLAAKVMQARGGGAIIFISSLAGERAIWGRSAYNTSKAAIDGLMRSMALELAPSLIRVNAITPGYVWTPRWESIAKDTESRRLANIPAGAPTQQEEIARMTLFLASDAAPSLLGSRIVLDGGLDAQQVPRDIAV